MFITDNEEKKRKWPELWHDVPGYEGRYKVSNHGRVKSLERLDSNNHPVRERILKPGNNNRGYLRVNLCKNGKVERPYVHRLVAEAFEINRRAGQNEIDHIDGDKQNNCTWNLRWCTRLENEYNPVNTKAIPVESYDLITGETIKRYASAMEAERQDGYDNRRISDCINDRLKSHHGVGWRRQNVDVISYR